MGLISRRETLIATAWWVGDLTVRSAAIKTTSLGHVLHRVVLGSGYGQGRKGTALELTL